MATKVNDRFVEIAIVVITILVAVIGWLIDDKLGAMTLVMIEQNENQKETSREVSKINGSIQKFSSEISTLKANDKDIYIKVNGIERRVYKLEGAQ